jgi:hypothetical protein
MLVGNAWSLFIDHVTATVTAELESRGIASVLLKGAAFARLLYDEEHHRPYTDTDLLLSESDVPQAEETLRQLGFVRIDRDEDWFEPEPKYAHTFIRGTDRAYVDVHWRLSGAAARAERQWDLLSRHTTQLNVAGRSLTALDAAATAVLVALHANHHGTAKTTALRDIDQAVERVDLDAWNRARTLADQLGATRSFAAGLRLTESGDALAERLGLERRDSIELWLKVNPRHYGAWVLDRLTQTTTLRGRLRIVAYVLFPPPAGMRMHSPLARRGRAGLALAYALRPLRLVTRMRRPVRDWLRARRAVGG